MNRTNCGRDRAALALQFLIGLLFPAMAGAAQFCNVSSIPSPANAAELIYSSAANKLVLKNSGQGITTIDISTRATTTHAANSNFTDMSISPSGRFVFAADYGGENIGYGTPAKPSYVHRLDLSSNNWETRTAYIAGGVQAVADDQFILKSRDQWVEFTYNAWGTGSSSVVLNGSNSSYYAPGYYAGVYYGDFRYDWRTGRLLHGSTGSSSQEVQAFRLIDNDFQRQESSGMYGTAQGYGPNVALATDGSAFYYGRLQVDPQDVTHNLRVFPEPIYAATGSHAFGSSGYYDARTGALLGDLGISTTVYGLDSNDSGFWAFDSGGNMLRYFRLSEAACAGQGAIAGGPNYMPLSPGNSWQSRQVSNSSVDVATVGNLTSFGGNNVYPVTTSDGSIAYVTNDANGFRMYGRFAPSVDVDSHGTTQATLTFSPPVTYLPATFTIGQQTTGSGTATIVYQNIGTAALNYSASSTVVGLESVTVPAGTYQALKVNTSVTISGYVNGTYVGMTSTETNWLADGIGLVKSVTSDSSGTTSSELVSTNVSVSNALTVSNAGGGSVTSSPAGINCGTACSSAFSAGQTVTLTASPNAGYLFSGWSGACAGTGSICIVTANGAQSVTASFAPIVGATASLGNLAQTYDGTAKAASCTTTPAGLSTQIGYSDIGAGAARINAGSYGVTCTVTQNGYSGSASGTLVIAKSDQSITFIAPSNKTLADAPFMLTATASSGLSVSLASQTPSACSIAGAMVTVLAGGTCKLTADQAGNGNYNAAAQVTWSITIGKANQTISFGAAPILPYGGSASVSATTTSGLAVSFGSTTPAVCSVSGNTVTALASGACIVRASQTGNNVYTAAADVTQTLTVGQPPAPALAALPPMLSFTSPSVGTPSATQSVALTNSGGATLSIGSIAASGDFSQTNNCGATLTPGQSCAVTLAFTPAALGVRTGDLTITSNAPGSPHNLALAGSQGLVLQLVTGWNLIGNGYNLSFSVPNLFGDSALIASIWKWQPNTSRWAFYAPSLTGTAMADYAAARGYDVLDTIGNGEGFWVNTKQPVRFEFPTGTPVRTSDLQPSPGNVKSLAHGWSLIAVGEATSPRRFNSDINPLPPSPGVILSNLVTSIWAWDSERSTWYFYSPSLDANGELSSYATGKGYLDFIGTGKTLGPGEGFWVNAP